MTTEVAIQTDAPQTTEVAADRPLSPHAQRMAEVVAKREAEQKADIEAARQMRIAEGVEAEAPEQEAEQAEQPAPSGEAAPAAPEAVPQKIKLKVHGREVELPMDEVIRRVQKDVAADERLAYASEAKRQAELLAQQNAALNAELQRQLASVRALPETPDTEADEEAIQGLIDAMLDGKAEEAKKGFQQLLAGRRQATPDVNQIAATVRASLQHERAAESAAEAAARHQQALVDGLDAFRETYSDLANDSRLFAYANAESDIVAQENPHWTPKEIFLEAGKRVTEMLKQRASTQPVSRQDLKSRLERPVVGANSAASLGDKPTPPVTTQSVIERMRAARGQK